MTRASRAIRLNLPPSEKKPEKSLPLCLSPRERQQRALESEVSAFCMWGRNCFFNFFLLLSLPFFFLVGNFRLHIDHFILPIKSHCLWAHFTTRPVHWRRQINTHHVQTSLLSEVFQKKQTQLNPVTKRNNSKRKNSYQCLNILDQIFMLLNNIALSFSHAGKLLTFLTEWYNVSVVNLREVSALLFPQVHWLRLINKGAIIWTGQSTL